MTDNGRTLTLIYNADGSVLGKLVYGFFKIRSTEIRGTPSPCPACDITHAGLSLKEAPTWIEAKKEIEASSDLNVVQLHRDELPEEVGPLRILFNTLHGPR